MPDEETKNAYKDAFQTWQRHLTGLHEVFLEGRRLDPVRLKGLLNRESRAKRRYDRARLRLLGIEDDSPEEAAEEDG